MRLWHCLPFIFQYLLQQASKCLRSVFDFSNKPATVKNALKFRSHQSPAGNPVRPPLVTFTKGHCVRSACQGHHQSTLNGPSRCAPAPINLFHTGTLSTLIHPVRNYRPPDSQRRLPAFVRRDSRDPGIRFVGPPQSGPLRTLFDWYTWPTWSTPSHLLRARVEPFSTCDAMFQSSHCAQYFFYG